MTTLNVDQFDGDIALMLGADGGYIDYIGGQPVMDAGGLETAVNISLFTQDGWWGNALYSNDTDSQIGSDFEERVMSKSIDTLYLRDIEEAGKEALQWMINVSLAQSVETEALWPELDTILYDILITKPDNTTLRLRYELNWQAGFLKPVLANII